MHGHKPQIRPLQQSHLPVYFGGSSDAAIEVAARHAEVYALWGESLAAVEETIANSRHGCRLNAL
ncbi:LLM class flavin-dependent oxidoreductase [Paraburkholderia sp. ZP32-5]|uniref:LLM class flavin-dependent oxidoreductase n=1 Tax=Paraburkholderia sp. ZP32-5 TaxID=2883245 RepID=UPI002DD43A02|nr:LLM class flavin-dependent oxidoreductase [Paraburkholderia sp. ZP32-5]